MQEYKSYIFKIILYQFLKYLPLKELFLNYNVAYNKWHKDLTDITDSYRSLHRKRKSLFPTAFYSD